MSPLPSTPAGAPRPPGHPTPGHPTPGHPTPGRRTARSPLRGRLVVNSVVVSVLLVLVTALAVAAILVQATGREIELAADRRLADGGQVFRGNLDDRKDELSGVAAWLSSDPALSASLQSGRLEGIEEQLAKALQLPQVDEVLVAAGDGTVLVRLQLDRRRASPDSIAHLAGLREALAGRGAFGIDRGEDGVLRLQIYTPVQPPGGERPVGVLRVASFIDGRDLDLFRVRTGLDVSVFFGDARVVTTLRQPDGTPLVGVGPLPEVATAVVGEGRSLVAWRDLPIGRFRTHYLPLLGPDGSRVGMLAVALPVRAIDARLREVLLPVAPAIALILVAAVGVTAIVVQRIRYPVLALAAAAARLRRGDLSTPVPPVEERELAPIADQLELARRSIHDHLRAASLEEARQRTLLAVLREPAITTSPAGRVAGFNRAATQLFGEIDRFYGRSIRDLLPFLPEPDPEQPDASPVAWQGRVVDQAGRPVDVSVSRTHLAEGQLPATDVYVVYDVSPLAELNRLREELLYNVAHELRGPLQVLDNALTTLATEYTELSVSEVDHLNRMARRTTTRLRMLMEDLLNAGTIQSGRFRVYAEPTALSALVEEALETVGPMTEARAQQVVRDLPPGPVYVMADIRYARQVISNFVANASKYSPEGQPIVVRARTANDWVRIEVQDRGPGIPPEQRAGLFERFYRPRPNGDAPGIGLGLAIAKGIVQAHGGEIGFESGTGGDGSEDRTRDESRDRRRDGSADGRGGTTVWFTLPLAPAAPGAPPEDLSERGRSDGGERAA